MNITLKEGTLNADGIVLTNFLILADGATIAFMQSSEHCRDGITAEKMRTFANLFVAALKNHETEKQNHE